MPPNGYDPYYDPEEMNGHHEQQPHTFKEVMAEALAIAQVPASSESEIGRIEIGEINLYDFIPAILQSSDVPPKARPFTEQLGELQKHIAPLIKFAFPPQSRGVEPDEFMEEELTDETVSELVKNAQLSLDALVKVSKVNSSLKVFSESLRRETEFFLTMLSETITRSQQTEELISALDDLYE